MAFLAVVILGCVTYVSLPVSLLPDIDIPHISVKVTGENMSSRELESTMVAPLRRQLMQVGGLSEIRSETRNASAVINMTMDYGVNTDLAFIEVNEKIDAAMNSLPRDAVRPRAVKASATDIPVLYLSMTTVDENDFISMSDVADNIVKRRLEQLPEVAMVDITGIPAKELRVTPDEPKMQTAGLYISEIESALNSNNAEPGSMTVRDGYYEYNIRMSNQLRTPDDVRRIKITKNGRIYELGDFCAVTLAESQPEGYSTYNGKRAVTMAIIKHDAESMGDMEAAVDDVIALFGAQYPGIEINKSRSQTALLDFTIDNLEQNLILGLILVFVVCALFMRSFRLPFVIAITIIVAVIGTFLLFYLFKVSINIISLAGMILAVGMMIDNSVIVSENITQYMHRGMSIEDSCVAGTNEMITPMLSSSLTTVAVFVPLVFMSGIAGAIFADQAFSITAGLAASYIVGITLLPVLYYMLMPSKARPKPYGDGHDWWGRAYDKGIDWVFGHKTFSVAFTIVAVVLVVPLFGVLDTERMPKIDSSETMMTIDWNENINLSENDRRTEALAQSVREKVVQRSASVGVQDYMLNSADELAATESQLYFRTPGTSDLAPLKEALAQQMREKYPHATYEFSAPDNIFEKVFSSNQPPLEARVALKGGHEDKAVDLSLAMQENIRAATGVDVQDIPLADQININVDRELLALYKVSYEEVQRVLRTAFRGSTATTLRSYQEYMPVKITNSGQSVQQVLSTTLVEGAPGKNGTRPLIPLSALVKTSHGRDFKSIHAAEGGEFIPVAFDIDERDSRSVIESVTNVVSAESNTDVSFAGAIFENAKMMKELAVILIVSLLLMYFILCAQFESFSQPLVVLLEIPVDITFALLSLWMCGQTLNLMSAIGIIVTCGIVVNDSILKLDAINELRKEGMPLYEAIHVAGHRRLKPIIMTSLTTIFAMVPVLFTSDMGSELQRPLAIAMIGSMLVGTIVSIFLIPLVYFLIYRKHHVEATA